MLLVITITLYWHFSLKRDDSICNKSTLHMWFSLQATFIISTFIIAIYWFVSGNEFLFDYGDAWLIIERGTLKSISSVVGVVGIGSLLLGWTYGERDKVTLGKTQIDIIHYLYGIGYSLGIILHFIATALCIILIECEAKEASMWAFITVIVGCVPQMSICLRVVFNLANRERVALLLWKIEAGIFEEDTSKKLTNISKIKSWILEKISCNKINSAKKEARNYAVEIDSNSIANNIKIDVAINMANYLSDFDIRHNLEYQTVVAEIIAKWLQNGETIIECWGNSNILEITETTETEGIIATVETVEPTETVKNAEKVEDARRIVNERIQKLSSVFHELFDHIPKEDADIWEEEVLKQICKKWLSNVRTNKLALNILVASYIHFLHIKCKGELSSYIKKKTYFSKRYVESYKVFCDLLESYCCSLEWYQYLYYGEELPYIRSYDNKSEHSLAFVFQQMVLAIYSQDKPQEVSRFASIAWSQVNYEVN